MPVDLGAIAAELARRRMTSESPFPAGGIRGFGDIKKNLDILKFELKLHKSRFKLK